MKLFILFHLTLWQIFASTSHSASLPAKVVLLRGKVTSTDLQGQALALIKGSEVNEGSTVETQKGSVVKLIFSDKSLVTIGPKSKMILKRIQSGQASVFSLLKGKVRSQVNKDLLKKDTSSEKKSSFFLKTKSAAMGVRGTDFSSGYDPSTGATSLDVISGNVKMVNTSEFIGIDLNPKSLDQLLNSPASVKVGQGFRSEISSTNAQPTLPQKIPENELINFSNSDIFVGKPIEAPETNESKESKDTKEGPKEDPNSNEPTDGPKGDDPNNEQKEESESEEEGAQASGDILPPGVPTDLFLNESPELEEFEEGTIGGPPPPEDPNFQQGSYTTLNPDLPPPEFEQVPEEFEGIIDDVTNDVEGQIEDNFNENSGQTSSRVIFLFN